MPDAYCTPGQMGTEAYADGTVTLSPADLATGDFGSEPGTIKLISNDNGSEEAMDLVGVWLPKFLEAKFRPTNLGTGDDDEDFTIELTTKDGKTYVATPVWVTGPKKGNWPPTHGPAAVAAERARWGELQPRAQST